MSQAWVILSGKGGVGKSTLTSSLGVELAKRGQNCCCVDTDIGLRCLDLLFGLQDEIVYDVVDVAEKNSKLKYSVVHHHNYPELMLLPASQLRSTGSLDTEAIGHIVKKLKKHCGYIFLDAPAGVGAELDPLLETADRSILVTTPDDSSIRDAENTISIIREKMRAIPLLVVNRVNPRLIRQEIQYTPQTVAQLLDLPLLGYIPEDLQVAKALHQHRTPAEGEGEAQKAIARIASRFLGDFVEMPPVRKKYSFFARKL